MFERVKDLSVNLNEELFSHNVFLSILFKIC